jgi:hypothetical protein
VVATLSRDCWRHFGDPETGRAPISSCRRAGCEISNVFPAVSGAPDSTEVLPSISRDCRRHFCQLGGRRTGSAVISPAGVIELTFPIDRIEFPNVFRGVSRTPDSTEVVSTLSRDCWRHFGDCETGRAPISSSRRARCELSNVFPGVSGAPDSTEVLPRMSRDC